MIEIKETQYTHPEQTTGLHTNGPPLRFVRQDNGPWFLVEMRTPKAEIRYLIERLGFEEFTKQFCKPVGNVPEGEQIKTQEGQV